MLHWSFTSFNNSVFTCIYTPVEALRWVWTSQLLSFSFPLFYPTPTPKDQNTHKLKSKHPKKQKNRHQNTNPLSEGNMSEMNSNIDCEAQSLVAVSLSTTGTSPRRIWNRLILVQRSISIFKAGAKSSEGPAILSGVSLSTSSYTIIGNRNATDNDHGVSPRTLSLL